MPRLERQPVRETGRAAGVPLRVPETRPTPLQHHYLTLSAIALVCGAVAITALELGAPLGSLLVKACVLVGTPLLVVTMGDAALRIWRSAWAWMPVSRDRGMFRLSWVAAIGVLYVMLAVAAYAVLSA
jgi:hypothetical protein